MVKVRLETNCQVVDLWKERSTHGRISMQAYEPLLHFLMKGRHAAAFINHRRKNTMYHKAPRRNTIDAEYSLQQKEKKEKNRETKSSIRFSWS
jgi:transposase